jgi:aspartate racemase
MGPFASAEFVIIIYEENNSYENEKESPRLILSSDPKIPDRTTSILAKEQKEFVEVLIKHWKRLDAAGAELFIIPCMTSHYYWNWLPQKIRERTINLLDVADQAIEQIISKKFLLLETKGTYISRIFNHPQLIIPNEEDQETIHRMIYMIKRSGPL